MDKYVEVGDQFGRLTVIGPSDVKTSGKKHWLCRCSCGTVKSIAAASLKQGCTKSCGCFHREDMSIRMRGIPRDGANNSRYSHGLTRTSEHYIWLQMKRRCLDPNNPEYHNYGGRGVHVCERWLKFDNFISDMGKRPSRDHSIDRINNDGPYAPENCRWATRKEQGANRRTTMMLTYDGQTKSVREWAESVGLSHCALYTRIRRGMSVHDALKTPPRYKTDSR